MRILVLEWDSFAHEYVIEEFRKADHEVDMFPWPFNEENMRENDLLYRKLTERLREGNYDFVFSFNFFPIAAKACNDYNIKYAGWIYDTPFLAEYAPRTVPPGSG